ncbi:MAG: chromate transporter, partial [Rhodobacterales bacterium]|nr:chromate transporter [Rhodobacterales bacterium]
RLPWAQSAMQGANAAVVGVLGAALYDPVFVSGIHGKADFALAVACFIALVVWRLPSWAVVVLGALGGAALTVI